MASLLCLRRTSRSLLHGRTYTQSQTAQADCMPFPPMGRGKKLLEYKNAKNLSIICTNKTLTKFYNKLVNLLQFLNLK